MAINLMQRIPAAGSLRRTQYHLADATGRCVRRLNPAAWQPVTRDAPPRVRDGFCHHCAAELRRRERSASTIGREILTMLNLHCTRCHQPIPDGAPLGDGYCEPCHLIMYYDLRELAAQIDRELAKVPEPEYSRLRLAALRQHARRRVAGIEGRA